MQTNRYIIGEKILVVEYLNFYNVVFVYILKLLYKIDKVILMDSKEFFKKDKIINILKRYNFQFCDFLTMDNFDFTKPLQIQYELIEYIYNQFKIGDFFLKEMLALYPGLKKYPIKKNKEIIKSLSLGILKKFISPPFCNAIYYTIFLKERLNKKCFIYSRLKLIDIPIDKVFNLKNINYLQVFFNSLLYFLNIVFSVVNLIKLNFLKIGKFLIKSKSEIPSFNEKILIFPHQGLKYGKLFFKSYLIPDLPKKDFIFVEYDFQNNSFFSEIIGNYQGLGYNYFLIKHIHKIDLLKIFLKTKIHFFSFDYKKTFIAYITNLLVLYYYKKLLVFRQAKVALIGYDYLFPVELNFALYLHDIKTVAVQERLNLVFAHNFINFFNYYLVWGEKIKEMCKNKNTLFCEDLETIGPQRAVYIKSNKQNQKKRKIILAFDYHSPIDKYSNLRQPIVNWGNNAVFYNDLIMLAEEIPNIHIIIRGKNSNWLKIDYFKDIAYKINSLNNIEISSNYHDFNISYKLLNNCNLVIAKYTSIADEALSKGIPVIFHEYGKNYNKLALTFFDYLGYEGFAKNYGELKYLTKKFLREPDIIFKKYSKLREELYNNGFFKKKFLITQLKK